VLGARKYRNTSLSGEEGVAFIEGKYEICRKKPPVIVIFLKNNSLGFSVLIRRKLSKPHV